MFGPSIGWCDCSLLGVTSNCNPFLSTLHPVNSVPFVTGAPDGPPVIHQLPIVTHPITLIGSGRTAFLASHGVIRSGGGCVGEFGDWGQSSGVNQFCAFLLTIRNSGEGCGYQCDTKNQIFHFESS